MIKFTNIFDSYRNDAELEMIFYFDHILNTLIRVIVNQINQDK